jgi:hypothetical protein
VLQIGVHHGKIGRAAGQHALDAGARQSASADAPQAAHTGKPPRQGLQPGCRAIGRIVINKDDFEGHALQYPLESPEQFLDIVNFVEGRDDHRQLDRQCITVGIDHQSVRHH